MADQISSEDQYTLGIDVGSSSIKAALVQMSNGECVAEQRLDSILAYTINDNLHSEQNVALLAEYVDQCVRALPADQLKHVVGIGISGQMHGVVCWSSKASPWSQEQSLQNQDNDGLFVDEKKVSPLYTWQDNRCTPEFLASLPQSRSHLTVHTGYGCATLFWLNINRANMLKDFDRAATIADFIVAMLCDSNVPQMSPQNAASWGYFDTENNQFEESTLSQANFPVRMLPHIRPDNGVAGTLKRPWCGIQPGTIVGVALGDLQAYVLAILKNENEAVVNVSTSSQMVFVDHDFIPGKSEKTLAKVVPYFNGKYLYEGAALNGGNAISLFINFVHDSIRSFGCNITKDQVWRRMIDESRNLESNSTHPLPQFVPTFWGERHCPLQRASVCHLTPDNLHLAKLFRALCKGVIDNIHELVSVEVLCQRSIKKIIGTGTALLRNETLRDELQNRYKALPIHFEQSGSADSAVGAALVVSKLIYNSGKIKKQS